MKLKYIYGLILFFSIGCEQIQVREVKKIDPAGPGSYWINDIYKDKNAISVSGSYLSQNNDTCCIVAQYERDWHLKWYKTYHRPGLRTSRGISIFSGWKGTFVCIETTDTLNVKDITIINYDSTGNVVWEKKMPESKKSREITSPIIHDLLGNTYFTGLEVTPDDKKSIFFAKYWSDGETAWVIKNKYPEISCARLKLTSKKLNQFVIGGVNEKTHDFFFLRYDSTGKFMGQTQLETPDEKEETLADIKIDNSGNVYLTGTTRTEATGYNFLTVAYDSSDHLRWTAQFDGTSHRDDHPINLAIDDSANVYVTGYSANQNGTTDAVLIKYDRQGNETWQRMHHDKKAQIIKPYFLYIASYKKHVSGIYVFVLVDENILLQRYNYNGKLIGSVKYRCPGENVVPTAHFGTNYVVVESIKEKINNAFVIYYGQPGWAGQRWD